MGAGHHLDRIQNQMSERERERESERKRETETLGRHACIQIIKTK